MACFRRSAVPVMEQPATAPPPIELDVTLQDLPEQFIPEEDVGSLVANAADFMNGDMKTVKFGDEEVLLSRVANNFFAVSPKCTHVGAPLEKGVLNGDRVVCPWHGACFNVRTGDIEEGMVLQKLKSYRVAVREGKVYVSDQRPRLAIIGGGAAAAAAIEEMRSKGYRGSIDLFTQEALIPYDRTTIGKTLQRGQFLRNQDYYDQEKVNVHLESKVVVFDGKERSLELASGEKFYFDTFIIATGAVPRMLGLGEENLTNVHTLRSSADAEKFKAALTPDTRLVIFGSGVLGLEIASSAKTVQKVKNVTVIGNGRAPLTNLFGPMVHGIIRKLHESNGTIFVKGPATRLISDGVKCLSVEIENNTQPQVEGDVFLICVGVVPATDYIKNIPKNPDGSLLVDRKCRVLGCSEIYACGDCASTVQPDGKPLVVQHWGWSMQQGRIAASTICGLKQTFHCVPVFWTVQFGLNFRFCGTAIAIRPGDQKRTLMEILMERFDPSRKKPEVEAIISGTDTKFEVFYIVDGQIKGVASLASDPTVAAAAELMRRGNMLTGAELKGGLTPHMKLKQMQL